MVRVSSFIVQDHRCAVNIFDHNVNSPIVVEITKSSAAARLRDGNCRADEIADIPKCAVVLVQEYELPLDRKSTRLNSSHGYISYAVFCLKKKKIFPNSKPLHTVDKNTRH